MALEMFLKLDGVDGGTRNYQHKGWCDMLSWNWHLDLVSAEREAADGPCSGMNQITVLKALGQESPAILRLFAERTTLDSVEISAVPVVGKREAVQKYLAIKMEDVIVINVRSDGEAEENFFRERLIFQFNKLTYETYLHESSTGSTAGAVENFTFAWDLSNNSAV